MKHKEIGISEYPSAQKQRDCAQLETCISQVQAPGLPGHGHHDPATNPGPPLWGGSEVLGCPGGIGRAFGTPWE